MMSVLLIIHLSYTLSSQPDISSQKKRPGLKLYVPIALNMLPSTSSEVQLKFTETLPEYKYRPARNIGILVLGEKIASIPAFFINYYVNTTL